MLESLELCSVPLDEECQQVGMPTFSRQKETLELQACKAQIERENKQLFDTRNIRLSVKSNPHDFGTYRELVLKFNDEDEDACDAAYRIEACLPEKWDEESIKFLTENKYYEDTID